MSCTVRYLHCTVRYLYIVHVHYGTYIVHYGTYIVQYGTYILYKQWNEINKGIINQNIFQKIALKYRI